MDHSENTLAMNESQVAQLASVSIALVRKWRRQGTGPRFLKLGRLIRYRVKDVDAWLDSQVFDGGQCREAAEK